jgi:hypothetical protein
MRKQTNTLSPSPKGFQSPKISHSDIREVRGRGRPKSSDYYSIWFNLSAAFFISEKKTGVIKLKTHYFISYHVMKC